MTTPATSITGRIATFVNRRPWLQNFVYTLNDFQSKNYRQLGLRHDDCLDIEETEVGQLALKRLEAKEAYDRVYRIRRAVQLSLQQKILPKEQWTTREEDKPYISPIIAQIEAEKKEKVALDTMEVVKGH